MRPKYPRKTHRYAHKQDCLGCGYVRGASVGYDPLTMEQRHYLAACGSTLDLDVFGGEIATLPEDHLKYRSDRCTFYVAIAIFHHLRCVLKIDPKNMPTTWHARLGTIDLIEDAPGCGPSDGKDRSIRRDRRRAPREALARGAS